jgi:hypothetical protein
LTTDVLAGLSVRHPASGCAGAGFFFGIDCNGIRDRLAKREAEMGPAGKREMGSAGFLNRSSDDIEIDGEQDDIVYPSALPFVLVHLACIAAVLTGATWTAVAICVVL